MKTIFWIVISITLITLAASLFYLYQYLTTKDITLTLEAPREVPGGLPFEMSVRIVNESNAPIEDIEIDMVLPDNVFLAGNEEQKRFVKKTIAAMQPGEQTQEIIPLAIVGATEATKKIEVTMSYTPPALGGTARFTKTKTIDIAVRESAIALDMTTPQKVLNDEEFEIELQYENKTDQAFQKIDIALEVPTFFSIKIADPKPTKTPATWTIETLEPHEKKTITIKGRVLSTEQSFFTIKGRIIGNTRTLNEKTASIEISPSPLAVGLTVNNETNYTANPGDVLQYAINYRNNAEVGLSDVVIKIKLTGEMINLASVSTFGAFDSKNNVITWNAGTNPELRLVPPGGTGMVQFQVGTKPSYTIRRLSDKNFIIKASAEISSPTVPYYVVAERTVGIATIETKMRGNTVLDTRGYYYDTDAVMTGKGPLPPKANTPTRYAIRWAVISYATDATSIEIQGRVEPGVRVTAIKTNLTGTSTNPIYNERTGEIIWTIDRIPANKGVIGKPVEAVFQIEALPNITQIGRPMPLMGETIMKGIDEFTGSVITATDGALTTQLTDDTRVRQDQWNVTP